MGTVKGQINVIILRFILYIKVNKLLKLRNPKELPMTRLIHRVSMGLFKLFFQEFLIKLSSNRTYPKVRNIWSPAVVY